MPKSPHSSTLDMCSMLLPNVIHPLASYSRKPFPSRMTLADARGIFDNAFGISKPIHKTKDSNDPIPKVIAQSEAKPIKRRRRRNKSDKRGRKKKYPLNKLIEACKIAEKQENSVKALKLLANCIDLTKPRSKSVTRTMKRERKKSDFKKLLQDQRTRGSNDDGLELSFDENSDCDTLGSWDKGGRTYRNQETYRKVFPSGFQICEESLTNASEYITDMVMKRNKFNQRKVQNSLRLTHSELVTLRNTKNAQNTSGGNLLLKLFENMETIADTAQKKL